MEQLTSDDYADLRKERGDLPCSFQGSYEVYCAAIADLARDDIASHYLGEPDFDEVVRDYTTDEADFTKNYFKYWLNFVEKPCVELATKIAEAGHYVHKANAFNKGPKGVYWSDSPNPMEAEKVYFTSLKDGKTFEAANDLKTVTEIAYDSQIDLTGSLPSLEDYESSPIINSQISLANPDLRPKLRTKTDFHPLEENLLERIIDDRDAVVKEFSEYYGVMIILAGNGSALDINSYLSTFIARELDASREFNFRDYVAELDRQSQKGDVFIFAHANGNYSPDESGNTHKFKYKPGKTEKEFSLRPRRIVDFVKTLDLQPRQRVWVHGCTDQIGHWASDFEFYDYSFLNKE